MSKFNTRVSAARTGVLETTSDRATTGEGVLGYVRDAKSELFLAGVGAFFGEDKFYETGNEAGDRFRALAAQVTKEDPAWMREFLPWLRRRANIRTAALVGAAEYVRAGGTGGRQVVGSVLVRADEPGELLAYWISRYGRNLPAAIKRGVADSVGTLYSQKTVAKWDSARRSVRFADVVELTHPAPATPMQSALYNWLLDDRRGRGVLADTGLDVLKARQELSSLPVDERHAFMRRVQAGDAEAARKFELAMASQWEWAKSWLGG